MEPSQPSDFPSLFISDEDDCMESKPRILNFTYNTSESTIGVGVDKKQVIKTESLTTKNAVKFLLEGRLRKKVCRYCLDVASPLSELDQVLHVAGSEKLFKVTIRDMVASFYPYKVADDPNFPNKICNKCLNQTIRSYLFTQQCERSERALRNCFEDMYTKLDKLDPVEPQKKRGRQKINPNHNILYTNHEKVIDYAEPIINIVNSGSVLTEAVNTESKFECLKCWQVLPNMESLLNHEKQHPKSMWYSCRHCGKSFTKLNLLKRHVRLAHDLGKQLQQKTDFRCTACGVVSEKYNEHMQHIEKHKFQMVMDHLIGRDMDKLCAICLDNNKKLADLEDLVCLHGGFPEMMGERTLYSILGSTVPDKSSYKYRELLIPNHAKVVRVLKKNKDIGKHNFALSSPTVISKEDTDFDYLYLYIFCSPKNLKINDIMEKEIEACKANETQRIETAKHKNNNDLEGEGDNVNSIITSIQFNKGINENDLSTQSLEDTNEIVDETVSNLVVSKGTAELNQMIYSFSKPKYIDEVIIDETKIIKEAFELTKDKPVQKNFDLEINTTKSCKECWIFKKPSCESCLKSNENINKQLDEGNIKKRKQCEFCWVYKNCPMCEYCKTENKKSFVINNSDLNKKVESGLKLKEENAVKVHSNNKRKLTNDKPTYKRAKWQCQICLTANIDKNLCVCCDAQKHLYEGHLKVKFNFTKDFFKSLNDNNVNVFNVKTKDTDITTATLNTDEVMHEDIPQQLQNLVNSAKKPFDINITTENNVSYFDNIEMDASTSTDVNEHYHNEDMDIVEEDNNVSIIPLGQPIADCNWTQSEIISANLTTKFQFNIGTSAAADRKCITRKKMHLKRFGTLLHK